MSNVENTIIQMSQFTGSNLFSILWLFFSRQNRDFHKHTKLAIMTLMPNFVFPHISIFPLYFVPCNFCKHEIRHQWIQGHCTSMLKIASVLLISIATATKEVGNHGILVFWRVCENLEL